MRRRDTDRIRVSREWRKRAAEAAAKVSKGEKPADFGGVWGELKPDLAALSHQKCWYCESRQTRSDNAVDHFRPKSRYPWRAFEISNFRFACTFCNSRRTNPETGLTEGKGDSFPLLDGSPQASREEDIKLEQPLLLDPCVVTDCALVDFLSDGSPCVAEPSSHSSRQRVERSIEFYHLDHPELVDQRRLIGLEIQRQVELAEENLDAGGGVANERNFTECARRIANLIDDRAELSAFARRMLSAHRAKSWVVDILVAVT